MFHNSGVDASSTSLLVLLELEFSLICVHEFLRTGDHSLTPHQQGAAR